MSERIAIIAALEREVAPLREGYSFSRADDAADAERASAPAVSAYRAAQTLLLVAGMGGAAATAAARAALEFHPTLLVSAGFAGALDRQLHVADVLTPSKIIDLPTGRVFQAENGAGTTLISVASVLSRNVKLAVAARFSAQAVDMEAAAVAAVAEQAGIRFAAIKAISDPVDLDLPPLDRFIDSAGKLDLVKLAFYIVPRPRHWGALVRLGRNAARAADALAGPLAALMEPRPAPVK